MRKTPTTSPKGSLWPALLWSLPTPPSKLHTWRSVCVFSSISGGTQSVICTGDEFLCCRRFQLGDYTNVSNPYHPTVSPKWLRQHCSAPALVWNLHSFCSLIPREREMTLFLQTGTWEMSFHSFDSETAVLGTIINATALSVYMTSHRVTQAIQVLFSRS